MTTTTKRQEMIERIRRHGEHLLAIFPNSTERDPEQLCNKLRRLEMQGHAIAMQACNGPEFLAGEQERREELLLAKVNRLLGNVREHQPKTGAKCGCRRGAQRDNCPACEGTGYAIDFARIRSQPPVVPIFLNGDPRGYALKIDDEYTRAHALRLHTDWGGYGILAPDLAHSG